MTSKDLARYATPYLRATLVNNTSVIKQQIGLVAWVALWPAWSTVTGPLLPLLTRFGIELAIGMTSSKLVPILEFAVYAVKFLKENVVSEFDKVFLEGFFELVKMSKDDMLKPVQNTLSFDKDVIIQEYFNTYDMQGLMSDDLL